VSIGKTWSASVALAALLLASAAQAADPSWLDHKLLDGAKKEGTLVIYSSVNETEGLAIWRRFEEQTGIKIEYIRGSDSQIISRIMIENRGGKAPWDLVMITSAQRLPSQFLVPVEPPQAQHLFPAARGADRRWYGFAANYDVPAYNTKLVNAADLPKSYEEFAKKSEWAGRTVINEQDTEWVIALLTHYGEAKGRELIRSLAATLKPAIVAGHLAVARAVGAGEYAVALTNYANLTINVQLSGAPTDFWPLEPVGVFYQQVGVNAQSPHPNAARLGTNFILSKEGQQLLAARGRIPARPDVETNPPGVLERLHTRKVIPSVYDPARERKADALFKELIVGRAQ